MHAEENSQLVHYFFYVLGNRFFGKVIGAEPVLSRWRAREGELAGQNWFCTDDRFQ